MFVDTRVRDLVFMAGLSLLFACCFNVAFVRACVREAGPLEGGGDDENGFGRATGRAIGFGRADGWGRAERLPPSEVVTTRFAGRDPEALVTLRPGRRSPTDACCLATLLGIAAASGVYWLVTLRSAVVVVGVPRPAVLTRRWSSATCS